MPADEIMPDKLSVVIFSGHFDRIHYALVMAAAAAAVNRPVTLFFAMGAARALERDQGWRRLPCSEGTLSAAEMEAMFSTRGVAGFEDLLGACVSLEVRFLVCEMGLQALGQDAEALRSDVPIERSGVVTFLTDASRHGSMLFV